MGLIKKSSTDTTIYIGKVGVLVADTKLNNDDIRNYHSGLNYFGNYLNELNSLERDLGMMFDVQTNGGFDCYTAADSMILNDGIVMSKEEFIFTFEN